MVRLITAAALLFTTAASLTCLHARDGLDRIIPQVADSINAYMSEKASVSGTISIDSYNIYKKRMDVHLSRAVSEYPLRDSDISNIEDIIRDLLPHEYSGLEIRLFWDGKPLERLASGFFSGRKFQDRNARTRNPEPWLTAMNPAPPVTEGLYGRNIAVWAGHGYYYSLDEDRWKWQRAPFFSTIEDLLPHSYVTAFLAPMLENAGARVLMPRERDYQTIEIIVDNGDPFYSERNPSAKQQFDWEDCPLPGFGKTGVPCSNGENPFSEGTVRMVAANRNHPSTASYLPFFPETGDYAVYVSYASLPNSTVADYTVRYAGGEQSFSVDQSIGGGTWVYLGTFRFTKGETGQGVTVSGGHQGAKGIITSDAVRFGGGMGNIIRGYSVSGYPRYAEAARYWLQWSGFPEEVYSPSGESDDYKDDYMSRGEWVNSLIRDYGIPVDAALALHTDAGLTLSDSTIGTLAIYKEVSDGSSCYSDGRPRIMARELSDIVQTSIVEDIRARFRTDWTRRGIWDRSYMEARVPDVPTVLIELLSHQNFADMTYALDPEFKFTVSRAIYKGILKYLAYISGSDYTVQPLPVTGFSAGLMETGGSKTGIRLSWDPRIDPTEPTAAPDCYIVYKRTYDPFGIEEMPGFDSGTLVSGTEYTDRIEPGKLYSYKVVAVNRGGMSFPSEILSAGYIPESGTVLVVNGFTETSSPARFAKCDSTFAGFDFNSDHGVPYISDISYTGEQYGYDRTDQWIHDDRPGFGASYLDYGPQSVAGNTFDYPSIHGTALMRAGYSFCSTSLSAYLNQRADAGKYPATDLIFGKQTGEFLDSCLMSVLSEYCAQGGSLIVSGANIGKCSWYDSGTVYPATAVLESAMSGLRSSADRLMDLKDTLSGPDSGMISARIDSTAAAIERIVTEAGKMLGEDLSAIMRGNDTRFTAYRLASDIFGFQWSNGSASTSGAVRTVNNCGGLFNDRQLDVTFTTEPNPRIYCVESPDAIIPSDDQSFTFMRYETGNTSAAVAYDGDHRCVSLGFPIEALTSQHQVDDLMREVIRFLLLD